MFNLSEVEFHLGNKILFELYEYRDRKLQEDFIDKADITALAILENFHLMNLKIRNLKKS